MQNWLVVIAMVAMSVAGDYMLKLGSTEQNPFVNHYSFTGSLLYFGSAYGWLYLMTRMNLTQIATQYSVLTILALVILSLFVFKEEVSTRQLLGAALALVAVIISES